MRHKSSSRTVTSGLTPGAFSGGISVAAITTVTGVLDLLVIDGLLSGKDGASSLSPLTVLVLYLI